MLINTNEKTIYIRNRQKPKSSHRKNKNYAKYSYIRHYCVVGHPEIESAMEFTMYAENTDLDFRRRELQKRNQQSTSTTLATSAPNHKTTI